jgi:hypothetical protein
VCVGGVLGRPMREAGSRELKPKLWTPWSSLVDVDLCTYRADQEGK